MERERETVSAERNTEEEERQREREGGKREKMSTVTKLLIDNHWKVCVKRCENRSVECVMDAGGGGY